MSDQKWESKSTEELKQLYEAACDRLEDDGYTAKTHSYSGRGMFGRLCWAITTNAPASEVGAAIIECDGTRADVPKRSDNMGLDMVYY